MKVAIFSPYFRDLISGGGEKHLLEIGLVLAQQHQVMIAIPKPNQVVKDREEALLNEYKQHYQSFIGKDLSQLKFIFTPVMTSASFWQKIWWTSQFDYLLAVTDGSLFLSLAKQNNLHFQVPFINFNRSLFNRFKLWTWQKKNANSKFTKQWIEKCWHTKIQYVVYPLVSTDQFNPYATKNKTIVNVGRFFRSHHSKRQDVLIRAFIKMREKYSSLMRGWKLILIGSVEDRSYVRKLKEMSRGLPIEFKTIVQRDQLIHYLNQARYYWHATGFGVNQQKNPEKLEHFGISTAEAMSAGAIPLVYFAGGQKEVLGNGLKDLGWRDENQLITTTQKIMKNASLEAQYRRQAILQAQKFDQNHFEKAIKRMI